MFVDSWALMRKGATVRALRQMRQNLAEHGGTSETMSLGIAYLWLQDYQAAWEQFNRFNDKYPRHVSVTYGMAGVARWCLNDPEGAVTEWREGIDCEFTDWAGGITLPLLLFFVSAVKPDFVPRTEAQQILIERINSPLAENWPGAVAEYALGLIDEDVLRNHCYYKTNSETVRRRLKADFYVAVVEFAQNNATPFGERMHRISDISWAEFDADQHSFLAKLWAEEFFLARHEARR